MPFFSTVVCLNILKASHKLRASVWYECKPLMPDGEFMHAILTLHVVPVT